MAQQSLQEFRREFDDSVKKLVAEKGKSTLLLTRQQYDAIVNRLLEMRNNDVRKSTKDYRMLNKYEVFDVNAEKKLRKVGTVKRYLCIEELFDAIHTAHLSTGHGARDITHNKTTQSYANTTKEVIQLYVNLCAPCNLKKSKVRKSLVVKPIISNEMNSRCQVDLIDMQSQPDNDYKFIMNYQDHLTKFVVLRPLYTKATLEVAHEVVDLFCLFGNPPILQICSLVNQRTIFFSFQK